MNAMHTPARYAPALFSAIAAIPKPDADTIHVNPAIRFTDHPERRTICTMNRLSKSPTLPDPTIDAFIHAGMSKTRIATNNANVLAAVSTTPCGSDRAISRENVRRRSSKASFPGIGTGLDIDVPEPSPPGPAMAR